MGRRGRKVEPLTVPWDYGSHSNPLHGDLLGATPAEVSYGDDDDEQRAAGRGCQCLHSGKWSCRPDYAARERRVHFYRIKSPVVRSALQRIYSFVAVYRRPLRMLLIALVLLGCFQLFGRERIAPTDPLPAAASWTVSNDATHVGCLEANISVRANTSCIAANINTWKQFDGTARALFAAAAGRPAPARGVCAERPVNPQRNSNRISCAEEPSDRPEAAAGTAEDGHEAQPDSSADHDACELPLVLSALAGATQLLASWPSYTDINASLPTSYSAAMLEVQRTRARGQEQLQQLNQVQQVRHDTRSADPSGRWRARPLLLLPPCLLRTVAVLNFRRVVLG